MFIVVLINKKLKKDNNMKIAISSTGEDINNHVTDVFGRCAYFILAEIKDKIIGNTELLKNENTKQIGGVGISTAQLVAEKGINVVITKNMGPRAMDVLKQFNIEVYFGDGVIKDVLQSFIDGKLKKIGTEDACEQHKI